jgi:hypothetical protein
LALSDAEAYEISVKDDADSRSELMLARTSNAISSSVALSGGLQHDDMIEFKRY